MWLIEGRLQEPDYMISTVAALPLLYYIYIIIIMIIIMIIIV